ncbi:Acyl-CoA wax alcohol acyltransferase 1 [Globodera pallida]|nr:Acyl-CoA wax alcohol acyltransferase 1 [Globodera pallida]
MPLSCNFGACCVEVGHVLAVWLFQWMIVGWAFVCSAFFFFLLLHRTLWPLALLYFCWFCYDFNSPRKVSRPVQWIRNLRMWRMVAEYFPVETVKTAELPTDRNYIFAAHPHGVFGISSALTFGTNGTRFQQLFPGIKCRVATLSMNLAIPFRREFLMALGVISSSATSIGHVLSLPPEGNSVGIVPGGVAEIFFSQAGGEVHKLKLANRKGFVKMAIKYGADLVPVYHFGEQELMRLAKLPDFLDKFQNWMRRVTGAFIPLAYGQSLVGAILPEKLSRRLPSVVRHGTIPFRQKIVTIVGAPIRVQKNENPGREEVDKLHEEYCGRLKAMFDRHKVQMGGLSESARIEFA